MENVQEKSLFDAPVSQLGLAAIEESGARGIAKLTLPHHSSQGLSCEILIPETCLVVLQITEHQGDHQGGLYPFTYTTCYHGRWYGDQLHRFYEDVRLMVNGRRRDHAGTTRLHGSFTELHVWIGSGQKDVSIASLPGSKCFLADNLLLKATFR